MIYFQGIRDDLENIQVTQQIIQIHWIDALLNSKASFYRFFDKLNFLNPTSLCCRRGGNTDISKSTKIVNILHSRKHGDLLNDFEKISGLSRCDRDDQAISAELRKKLDDLCVK